MLAVTLAGVASTVVAIAAFFTALGVLSRLRPSKWVWRHLVSDPLSNWFRAEMVAVVDEKLEPIRYQLEMNGGQSIKDAIGRLEVGQTTLLEAHKSSDSALALHIEKFHPLKENT